jgi:RNA polymerase sigma-70 factor (ECF subfamily)
VAIRYTLSYVWLAEMADDVDERASLERLRAGDKAEIARAFARHRPALLALARAIAGDSAAEEVLQEAWARTLAALPQFEGRSSFRTWLGTIVVNVARRRASGDKRLVALEENDSATTVDPSRFTWIGSWAKPPRPWIAEEPEALLLAKEAHTALRAAIEALPANQRAVITLRDLQEWTSEEVCLTLGIEPGNERVLLHRARSRLRATLEAVAERRKRP